MAKSRIERFISGYLRNKKISETKKGYADWLSKNGLDPTADLSEKIGSAAAEHARSISKHGSSEEALRKGGLRGSGYAGFLKEEAEKIKNDGFESAALDYVKRDIENRDGYDEELDRLEKIRLKEEKEAKEKAEKEAREFAEKAAEKAKKLEEERIKAEKNHKEKLYNSTKAELEKRKIINYEKAYEYAKNMGLDETRAAHLAKTVTDSARGDAVYKVTNAIFDKTLTMMQAEKYAKSLGLGEEDVKALAELAYLANESVNNVSSYGEYLEYLRNKAN